MDVGNCSNRACWWLTACTQKREASLTCFLIFTSGVFSPLASRPPSISSLFCHSPPLSLSLLLPCDLFFTSSLLSSLLFNILSLLFCQPHSLLFSLPPATLLPFTLLPPSSLSLLACPTAERLQSEPSHLYPSLLLYNHPQNALMRYRESCLRPQQVSARLRPHLAASWSACVSCFYAFDEVMETVLWDVTQDSRSWIIM